MKGTELQETLSQHCPVRIGPTLTPRVNGTCISGDIKPTCFPNMKTQGTVKIRVRHGTANGNAVSLQTNSETLSPLPTVAPGSILGAELMIPQDRTQKDS